MGAIIAKLLNALRIGGRRAAPGVVAAADDTALAAVRGAVANAGDDAVAAGAEAGKGMGPKIGEAISNAWARVRGRPLASTAVVGGGAVGAQAVSTYNRIVGTLKAAVPLALIGGALAGAYLLLKGGKKESGADMAPDASLAPQDIIAQPQMEHPLAAPGATVVAAHPAGVVDTVPVRAQQASVATEPRWQDRVGRPRVQESFLAAEQARSEAAAAQQKTV